MLLNLRNKGDCLLTILCLSPFAIGFSPNAAAWLSVLPSPGLNLHVDLPEFQVTLKWWLGMGLGSGPQLQFLSKPCLGSFGPPCHYLRANVSTQVEVGNGFGHGKRNTKPADALVPNWSLGKPAAFDLTVLTAKPNLSEAVPVVSDTAVSAALVTAECRKHDSNDSKCSEMGWKYTTSSRDLWLLGC
ncbi:hypothetical protein EMCRGX_G027913 [Ephydatia muelleri]